jgi:transposase
MARKETSSKLWATKLLERKPARVVTVALATKTARIVWAAPARGEDYAVSAPAAAA